MASELLSTARELPRLREISLVFLRHGLGDLVRRAGVATLLERAGQVLHWGEAAEIAHLNVQQRTRLAFEQLGPTFVKLGQMLSTREDLLPPAWTTELARFRSTISCRRSNRRLAAHRSKCSPTLSANPTPPPRLRRYTGPNSPAARRWS
jgi:hypothetical protein